jgi:hypothetical protein
VSRGGADSRQVWVELGSGGRLAGDDGRVDGGDAVSGQRGEIDEDYTVRKNLLCLKTDLATGRRVESTPLTTVTLQMPGDCEDLRNAIVGLDAPYGP